ncbi:hypothetical protein AT730_24840 (plasmid) [Vibrio alginolyticus]|nr:hypothetical protein AT730_24840 [Vibrio alginolyticus]
MWLDLIFKTGEPLRGSPPYREIEMSENNAIYSNVTFDVTLEALLESPCLLRPCEAGYQPPTPEQVAFVQHYIGLSSEALTH